MTRNRRRRHKAVCFFGGGIPGKLGILFRHRFGWTFVWRDFQAYPPKIRCVYFPFLKVVPDDQPYSSSRTYVRLLKGSHWNRRSLWSIKRSIKVLMKEAG